MTEISAQSLHLIFVTSIYLVPMERKMMFDDLWSPILVWLKIVNPKKIQKE